jgi:hypothetical protein
MSTGVMHVAVHSVWPKTIYRLVVKLNFMSTKQEQIEIMSPLSLSLAVSLSVSHSVAPVFSTHQCATRVGKGHDESKDHEGIVLPRRTHVGSIHGHEWSPAKVEE